MQNIVSKEDFPTTNTLSEGLLAAPASWHCSVQSLSDPGFNCGSLGSWFAQAIITSALLHQSSKNRQQTIVLYPTAPAGNVGDFGVHRANPNLHLAGPLTWKTPETRRTSCLNGSFPSACLRVRGWMCV